MLRPADAAWLDGHEYQYSVIENAAGTHLVIRDLPLPSGLQPDAIDVLIVLPPGFADVGPDMFWCQPAVSRSSGVVIAGTETRQQFFGQDWQRWSRHIGGSWRPGIDNLATYVAYVRRALAESAEQAA